MLHMFFVSNLYSGYGMDGMVMQYGAHLPQMLQYSVLADARWQKDS